MTHCYRAWCYASGHIGIGTGQPDGAVVIATGDLHALRDEISAVARHGYEGELLLPGLPEADSIEEAIEAVVRFVKWSGSRRLAAVEWRAGDDVHDELTAIIDTAQRAMARQALGQAV